MDFDYKKYSLEQLDNWMHDAMSSGEASPQEIYDVIVGVVKENYYTYKHQASQAYELLSLLNSGVDNNKYQNYLNKVLSCDKDDQSEECRKSWTSFWEDNPSQKEYKGSTVSSVQYTEEELNAMCDKAASDQEKEQCREYNLREAEYYDKRAKLDSEHSKHYYDYTRNDSNRKNPFLTYDEAIADGWEMTADGFWIKEEKVKKWILPVEEAKDVDTDKTDYFVSFPDDLLEAADLKEGDQVRWVDNGDGSYTITKVTKPLGMDEC
jgi:hypothetical protein